MKICPRCNQTYEDDSLNFCLNDGSVLTQASGGASASLSDAPPTVLLNQPPATNPNAPQFGTQAGNWGVVTPNAAQVSRPKSRVWLWVLAIFGGVIIKTQERVDRWLAPWAAGQK